MLDGVGEVLEDHECAGGRESGKLLRAVRANVAQGMEGVVMTQGSLGVNCRGQ